MPLTADELKKLSMAFSNFTSVLVDGVPHVPFQRVLNNIAAYTEIPYTLEFNIGEKGNNWKFIPGEQK